MNVEAKAADTTVTAAAKFPVGDCVSAFQSDLTRLRIGPLAEVWPTADEMRKPDTSLSRVRYFPIRPRRGDLAILDRLAAGYQQRGCSRTTNSSSKARAIPRGAGSTS